MAQVWVGLYCWLFGRVFYGAFMEGFSVSNEAGYTKGPWDDYVSIGGNKEIVVCTVPFAGKYVEQARADARLIAAAPSLYEALAALVAEWEAERLEWIENRPEVLGLAVKQPWTGSTIINAARAALAKADGTEQKTAHPMEVSGE